MMLLRCYAICRHFVICRAGATLRRHGFRYVTDCRYHEQSFFCFMLRLAPSLFLPLLIYGRHFDMSDVRSYVAAVAACYARHALLLPLDAVSF